MSKINTSALKKVILEDLKQYQKNFSLHMGQEISNVLYEEAHSAIRDFYTSYHPDYYERNYNFWKSYKKINTSKGGARIAGVELLVDQLPDDYRKQSGNTFYSSYASANPEDVFWRVYGFGWHGIASLQNKAPTLSPPPYERLIKKRDEIVANPSIYAEKAYRKAKKDKYNYLTF